MQIKLLFAWFEKFEVEESEANPIQLEDKKNDAGKKWEVGIVENTKNGKVMLVLFVWKVRQHTRIGGSWKWQEGHKRSASPKLKHDK